MGSLVLAPDHTILSPLVVFQVKSLLSTLVTRAWIWSCSALLLHRHPACTPDIPTWLLLPFSPLTQAAGLCPSVLSAQKVLLQLFTQLVSRQLESQSKHHLPREPSQTTHLPLSPVQLLTLAP